MLKSHWTPRYVVNRLLLSRYQRAHPDQPWLTRTMIDFLTGYLRPTDLLVEFGSGRSTMWFAKRVAHVISAEHNEQWHAKVAGDLGSKGFRNVTYLRVDRDPAAYIAPVDAALRNHLASGKADVILVDGINRDHAAMWALEHIKPGGLILVDNVNRHLPHPTHAPASLRADGPPDGPLWQRFSDATAAWRRTWTSDGVTDTAGFFAPL